MLETLQLSDEKPAVLTVRNTESTNILCIGLKKAQVLKRHLSPIPAYLIVLKGTINFDIDGVATRFSEMDTFEIPVNVLHEVTAIEESIFLVIKEKR